MSGQRLVSEDTLHGFMVVSPFFLPLRHFVEAELDVARAWARAHEPYKGAFWVVEASHPKVRYSWRVS